MTLQIPIQVEDRTIPADAPTKTARPVPDLAEFLHKLDKDYASMPKRTNLAPKTSRVEYCQDHDLPADIKTAMLVICLIAASAMGLVLSALSFVLGANWFVVITLYIAPQFLGVTLWFMWSRRSG